jgi:Na+/citrate or Na+/malate symporter
MLHEYVATGLTDSDAPLHASAFAALFVRCLIVGAVMSVAAWLLINVLLDQLAWLRF